MSSSRNSVTPSELQHPVAAINNLELQLDCLDQDMIDHISTNERAKKQCENLIRSLNGIGGVAKLVLNCHEMAADIQNFEAELAALNGEELATREENVLLRRELENAVKCMETLLLDTEPAIVLQLKMAEQKQKQAGVSRSGK